MDPVGYHIRMIRIGDYKLIVYPCAGIRKLFNLAVDPLEMNDLGSDPGQHTRMETLTGKLVDMQMAMRDTLNLRCSLTVKQKRFIDQSWPA